MSTGDVRVSDDSGPAGERAAADIWARATARRDADPAPASAEAKLPGIREALSLEGGSLHVARRPSGAVGFTVVVPQGRSLEVRYLAVAPDEWGTGIGRDLLDHVHAHARARGYEGLELWVIDANERAVQLYERAGWTATEQVKTLISTRRLERRFVRPAWTARA